MPVYVPIVVDSANPQLRLPGPALMGETAVNVSQHPLYLSGVYGLQTDVAEALSATGGSYTINSSRQIQCNTGTSVGGYGVVRTQRTARWRPGTTVSVVMACAFPNPGIALSTLRCGTVSQSSALAVGYDGTTFGFLRQYAGGGTITVLTLSAGAAGAANATVTLNGVAYVVPLTAGTATFNCAELAAASYGTWLAYQIDNAVVFVNGTSASTPGAFTFAHASAAGTFAALVDGEANLVDTVAQADWNRDNFDGTGSAANPSGLLLDPAQLNMYRISFTWEIAVLSVYNPVTQSFVQAHVYTGLNEDRTQTVRDPTMQIGCVAASLGSSGTDLEVVCAWLSAEAESDYPPQRNPRSYPSLKTGLATGSEISLLSVRNGPTLDGALNQFTVEPKFFSVFNGSGKDAIVRLRLNATVTGSQFASLDSNSCANASTVGTTVSGGTALGAYTLAAGTSFSEDLSNLEIMLARFERITISIEVSTGAAYSASATLAWRERS
jgi:hypothetical protein